MQDLSRQRLNGVEAVCIACSWSSAYAAALVGLSWLFPPALWLLCLQGSANPGAADVDVDPMEEENEDRGDDDDDEERKEEEDGAEDEKTRAEEGEPPAFGVEGDGGDSSVLEAAKEEVKALL